MDSSATETEDETTQEESISHGRKKSTEKNLLKREQREDVDPVIGEALPKKRLQKSKKCDELSPKKKLQAKKRANGLNYKVSQPQHLKKTDLFMFFEYFFCITSLFS